MYITITSNTCRLKVEVRSASYSLSISFPHLFDDTVIEVPVPVKAQLRLPGELFGVQHRLPYKPVDDIASVDIND